MSESSSNIASRNLKNKTQDIQGGEKKVMKKSLSVVLSTAMALSMFSSVAFGKTSADFTDLKDLDAATKAKFDALISAGIFDGTSETTFGLKEEMNRAQFAKVAALITLIDVNKDLKTSSFSDVKSDDAANGYALPFIEALKTAGITDGYGANTYNPAGKVTKEQLATFLVRVLGKDADAKAKTGTDATVSDWAQGYVALALELKLLPAGTDGKFGGQSNATRDLLLTGAYEAKQQYVPVGKVSVTAAKATGVKKVTVSFNKPVDIEKAKVALKKGSVDVKTEAKFADDKKSVVLTLTEVKITDGDYSVALSGIDAASLGTATASFKGEAEVVKKIDFASASDTIAQTKKAQIKLSAKNQYDEPVSKSASSFTAVVSGFDSNLVKDTEGNLILKVDTLNAVGSTTTTSPGMTMIPVYVYENDTRISVQKTFKLGTVPFVSKLELGEPKYSNDKKALSSTGETVIFPMNQYDQYGNPVAYDDAKNSTTSNVNVMVAPYEEKVKTAESYSDFDNDGFGEIKLSLTGNVDKAGDYTVTVYSGSSTATGKFTVGSTKLATKIEFGDLTEDFSTGDTDKYIDLIAYDASGNKLSKDDIASNENAGKDDKGTDARIHLSGSNIDSLDAATPAISIVKSGQHKGRIKIARFSGPADSIAYLNAYIATANVNSNISKQIKIGKARYADSLYIVDKNKTKAVLGGKSDFKIEVRDQFGKAYDGKTAVIENGQSVTYRVYAELTNEANSAGVLSGISVVGQDSNESFLGSQLPGTSKVSSVYYYNTKGDFSNFNDGFTFKSSANVYGKGTLKVSLLKYVGGSDVGKEVATTTRDFTSIDPKIVDLTYALNKPTSLFAAIDSDLLAANQKDALTSSVARDIKVTAKDSSGDDVAISSDRVTSVSSSTYLAAVAKETNTNGGIGKVIGYKAGKADITVTYKDAKGNYKTTSFNVEVKADSPTADKFTGKEKYEKAGHLDLAWKYMDLKIVDQYGVEYNEAELNDYDKLLQVRYTVEAPEGTKVEINSQTGAIDWTKTTATSFTLKATTGNGKEVTTYVTNQ
ncbi:S-layer homology domain-containing protein [Paenibacillus sp. SYP-B3998]|uniref:S-layer homology domain-containing protein n=1 Tax=Paenibacillus sp. SYP-B3998 TaxID=2678564 RepID=A0A6G4A5E5_9BACL|nr:S-layer homology domain-containing protein [Paenibacillus sp. SYP-B3998]NEW08867.1 S-layer homology domain-containing protein [Paenibacillus sp. SYP-B3998]